MAFQWVQVPILGQNCGGHGHSMTPGMGVGQMGPCCPHPNCGGTPGQGVGLMGPVGQTGPGWNGIGMQIGCENPSETPSPPFSGMQCNAMQCMAPGTGAGQTGPWQGTTGWSSPYAAASCMFAAHCVYLKNQCTPSCAVPSFNSAQGVGKGESMRTPKVGPPLSLFSAPPPRLHGTWAGKVGPPSGKAKF